MRTRLLSALGCAVLGAHCCAVLSALGCVHPPVPSVPPRHLDAPNALLPPNLDAVVRVDMRQLEDQLGKEVADRTVLDLLASGEPASERALLGRGLRRSDLLWFGWSSDARGAAPENVLL